MKNNHNNTKIYKYTVTADSNADYNAGQRLNQKQQPKKGTPNPAIQRALRALKLVNPFRGV